MGDERSFGRRDFLRFAGTAAGGALCAGAAMGEEARKMASFREAGRFALDLDEPSSLAYGSDGTICVGGANRILRSDKDGKVLARFAVDGRPGCLAFLPDGRLLAGLRNRVVVFNSGGERVADWGDFGERGYFTSIVADENDVFVADAGNRVILRFGLDGKLRNKIGGRDMDRGIPGFTIPSPYFDVALDPMGSLWAVNCGKHGLENYRPNGDLVSSWYRHGMALDAFCGCCNPIHVAFRGDSTLVTLEKGVNRVKVFSPDNSLYGVVISGATPSVDDNKALFSNVAPPVVDLAVDKENRILLLNKFEKALLVYEEVDGK
jgi:hypothetical protein